MESRADAAIGVLNARRRRFLFSGMDEEAATGFELLEGPDFFGTLNRLFLRLYTEGIQDWN